jgi:hypothetical protein
LELERKLKTALDESRLLILGAQVLFGFQFEGVFQEQYSALSPGTRMAHGAGTMLLLVSIALLIAPSMQHQIVYAGESRAGALRAATACAGASLLPLTLGLGASTFVVLDHLFGRDAAAAVAGTLTLLALALLYGLGFVLKQRGTPSMQNDERGTPLKVKIEQLLTEARVLIPGAQALLGFQLVATLTNVFQQLPEALKYLHAAGLCAVAVAAMLLMTPAALHRIAYGGEDDPSFFRIGSALVVAAAFPLAIGIAADIVVVFYKISESLSLGAWAGAVALVILLGAWFGYPLWRRSKTMDAAGRVQPAS